MPAYFNSVSPKSPYGVYYVGEDDVEFFTSQETATDYGVFDRYGREITSGPIVYVPPTVLANDLAIGVIGDWQQPGTAPPTSPLFTPGGTGTNVGGVSPRTSDSSFMAISASDVQLSSSTPPVFGATVAGSSAWIAFIALIKSAGMIPANVLQRAVGTADYPAQVDPITLDVDATSTDSLLAVVTMGFGSTFVSDNAGNDWTLQARYGFPPYDQEVSLFTTKVANPESITSVICGTGGFINTFVFYEIADANNVAPLEVANANFEWSSGHVEVPARGASFILPAPAGGWKTGWKRVRLYGPTTDDPNVGASYGASNFVVLNDDARMLPRSLLPKANPVVLGAPFAAGIKALLGIGTSRIDYRSVQQPPSPDVYAAIAAGKEFWTESDYVDAVRPRSLWVAFSDDSAPQDVLKTPGTNHADYPWQQQGLAIFTKPAYFGQGDKIHITQTPGTHNTGLNQSGFANTIKITVYYPDWNTVAEVWDDLPSAGPWDGTGAARITAGSAFINAVFLGSAYLDDTFTLEQWADKPFGPWTLTIGNSEWTNTVAIVEALYAAGVTHFEGPTNEQSNSVDITLEMQIFQAAVHAGNASAKAMGPCFVSLTSGRVSYFPSLLQFCDAVSTHDYTTFGQALYDINMGRPLLQSYRTMLDDAGYPNIELWQTESGNDGVNGGPIYTPLRGANLLVHALMWEQIGMAREHNPCWYDIDHGFGVAVWLVNSDGSLQPQCMLYRTLVEETYGMLHHQALDFGTLGNHVFAGSIYQEPGPGKSCAVIWSNSAMPDCTVTLAVTGGTDPLMLCGPEGEVTAVPVFDGLAVIPIDKAPSYVRLPHGVSVSIYSCLDWPPSNKNGQGDNTAPLSQVLLSGGLGTFYGPASSIIGGDGAFYPQFSNGGQSFTEAPLPDNCDFTWPQSVTADRVVIFAAPSDEPFSTLLDFDVETSVDGTNWVVQATVTREGPFTLLFGGNTGTSYEMLFDDQWIFNVKFPKAVRMKALRLHVRQTTYGGAPDLATALAIGPGGTAQSQYITLQQVWVTCDANTRPVPVIAG